MSMRQVLRETGFYNTYSTADTKNYEGFPAWEMSLEKQFIQVLNTGSFGNSFYANQRNLITQSINTIKKAMDKFDSTFLKEQIVKARNTGFMRTAPIVALIFLRRKDIKAFKEIFTDVIRTGNDMEDFINLTKAFEMGFGRGVKETMIAWLKEKATPFYVIKYRRQIKDAMRISHPPYIEILDYVVAAYKKIDKERVINIMNKYTQIAHFEKAKEHLINKEIDKAIAEIKAGNLPPTALMGLANVHDSKFWQEMMYNMGTMQLLKNLNKLDREGVFKNYENIEYIQKRFTVENLKKAKVLPFRLGIAAMNVTDPRIKTILFDTLESYVREFNWGKWQGSWFIAPDISASMTTPVKGGIRPSNIAAVFTAILLKGIPDSIGVAWDVTVYPIDNNKTFTNIWKYIATAHGWGTYMELPIMYLIEKKKKVDYVVTITDSEEWGKGWLTYWKQYKKQVNPEAKAIFIRVDSYNTQPYSKEDEVKYDIYDVFGWSDSVIDWIEQVVLPK